MPHEVPFGAGTLKFEMPPWPTVDIAAPPKPPAPLGAEAIRQQLIAFAQDVRTDRPIVIAFTDATRASPDQTLLEPILDVLEPTGVPITLLCAVGMHRPSTKAEKLAKLGPRIVATHEIVDHDPAAAIKIGEIEGVPVAINRRLLDATIISLGVVEPHQYAGYSGGTKTCIIGCGGVETIGTTHGPAFLEQPGTRLGQTEGNPFQGFLRAAGALLDHDYAVNVVMSEEGDIYHLAAGAPDTVFDQLVAHARQLVEVEVPAAPYDIVITGVGAPKDINLYQASRAATYVGLCATPIIRNGGYILVPAPMPEGAGVGVGEQHMLAALKRFGPTQALIEHLRREGCRPGEQRAFMIAKMLQAYHMILVGAETPEFLDEAGLLHAPDMQSALAMTGLHDPRLLIIPHALQTLAVPAR